MDQWLVRTSDNLIAGPYTRDQVRKLITDGRLNPQDEICSANGYWVFLHEREEIAHQLGVELARMPVDSSEEITETQTETNTDDVTPVADIDDDGSYPELAEVDTPGSGSTMASRPARSKTVPVAASSQQQEQRRQHQKGLRGLPRGVLDFPPGPGEAQPSAPAVRAIAWAVILGLVAVVFAVIKLGFN